MIAALRCRLLDLGLVAALLALAAVPLILLRGRLPDRPEYLLAFPALFVSVSVLWALLARRQDSAPALDDAMQGRSDGRGGPWWHLPLIAALLGALTYLCFYGPLQIHFWVGIDEPLNFEADTLLGWLQVSKWMDAWVNRPLLVLPCALAQALAPGRIEGFLWLGAGLCWINGLLLFALLSELLPRARVLPVAAAVLLIIDRSDASRFLVMYTSNFYWTALALLLAALWLFVRSYRLGSRLLLCVSCLLLGGSLLCYEAAYPLAVLAPVLAWFHREHRRRLPVWAWAWVGTVGLLAVRFLLFLANSRAKSYQASVSAQMMRQPGALLGNLGRHLEASLNYFQTTGAALEHWRTAVAVLALVVILLGLAARRMTGGGPVPWRHYGVALGMAALAVLLGAVPFLHIPNLFRTQFFMAPGLAVVVACLLCLIGDRLGRRAGGAVVAGCLGLLAANAAAEALSGQRFERARAPVTFERTVHILQQVHCISPRLPPDTLVLLVSDDDKYSLMRTNGGCAFLGRRFLGAQLLSVPAPENADIVSVFQRDAVSAKRGETAALDGRKWSYDKVVAFRLAPDGALRLLRRLPARLLPAENSAGRYDPLALLRPGPVRELPYLRYPRWADRPHDVFDMADAVLLGPGWGPLEWCDGMPSRWVAGQAELVVNSLGQGRRVLRLRVEAERPGQLEAIDEQGQSVATAALQGRQEVGLELVSPPSRAGLFRLRVRDGAGAVQSFRAFGPPAPMPRYPTPRTDIPGDGLELRNNWYPLETYEGLTFRWVANDAEVVVDDPPSGGGCIVLDMAAGFALLGQPCQLTLRDESGRALADACVSGRREVRLRLPVGARPGAVFRLHVANGGRPLGPGQPTLNFRVFSVALAADAPARPGQ